MPKIDVERAETLERETLEALWDIEERLHRIREAWTVMSLDGQSSIWHQYDFDNGRLSVAQDICDDFIRGEDSYDDRRKVRDEQRENARITRARERSRGEAHHAATSTDGTASTPKP